MEKTKKVGWPLPRVGRHRTSVSVEEVSYWGFRVRGACTVRQLSPGGLRSPEADASGCPDTSLQRGMRVATRQQRMGYSLGPSLQTGTASSKGGTLMLHGNSPASG
jgi:hypothetical protein